MTENLNKVIAIVGPTASGKTSYSIELAKEINGEIVSADSRLVYKDFNIATAKPTIEEMQGVKHYMIDIVNPNENYSVGDYVQNAKKRINEILKRGKTPIIVGGTGLYINALLMNYNFTNTKPNYKLREELKNDDKIYDKLVELDKNIAQTIDKNDRKKIIRQIEIITNTGKPITHTKNGIEYNIEWIGCNFPREELYNRINKRVDIMLDNGIIEETKLLLNKYGRTDNLIHTIGYEEIINYLDNNLSLEDSINMLKQNTRRYAKRQLTWFRKNENIKWNYYPEILQK